MCVYGAQIPNLPIASAVAANHHALSELHMATTNYATTNELLSVPRGAAAEAARQTARDPPRRIMQERKQHSQVQLVGAEDRPAGLTVTEAQRYGQVAPGTQVEYGTRAWVPVKEVGHRLWNRTGPTIILCVPPVFAVCLAEQEGGHDP